MRRKIKGYPFYEVDEIGNVYSLSRKVAYKDKGDIRTVNEKILKGGLDRDGYRHVTLYLANGKKTTKKVHRLMAKAFLTPIDGKTSVNHKDGNKSNNCITNLEWCNNSENVSHAYRTGLTKPAKGDRNHATRISDAKLQKMREMYDTGKFTIGELHKIFGISFSRCFVLVNRIERNEQK
jgi:hypothetical protein